MAERIIKLMKSSRHNLKFIDLSHCLYDLLVIGFSHSYLQSELMNIKILAYIDVILTKRTNDQEQFEVLAIAYQCCKNMIVEHRAEVCKFIEQTSESIVKFFRKTDVSDKLRIIRLKFMNIILIAHIPNIKTQNVNRSPEMIANPRKWTSILKEFEHVVKTEMTMNVSKYREDHSIEINPIIVQCVSRFCRYFYWIENIEEEQIAEDQPSSSKRVRISNKMEMMLDNVLPSLKFKEAFNWKWLTVLAEMISDSKDLLDTVNIPKILKMLADCQPLVEYNYQVYAFTKCCYGLLQSNVSSNSIIKNHIQNLWFKIADECLRVCSGNDKTSIEFHVLLQLLIRHEKYSNASFIESVLKMYATGTISRNDTTLKSLLITIKSFNLDSLTCGKELTSKALQFVFQKHTVAAALKKLIAPDNNKTSISVLCEVAICCCLHKSDVINFIKKNCNWNDLKLFEEVWDLKKQKSYKSEIEKLIHLINKQDLNILVLEDEDFLKVKLKKRNYFILILFDYRLIPDFLPRRLTNIQNILSA